MKGFAYYNNYGHIRYADFIFTEYNFSIIYLNFYDDTDIQLSGSDIEKAVINAGEYYENFSEGIKNHEITSWIFAEPFTIGGADELEWNAEWSDLTEEYMIYDVMYSDRDEVKYSLENMLKTASYNIYSSDRYWLPPM